MKIHLRGDSADGIHTRFTVFMNGANCGQLTMTEEEAVFFHDTVMFSSWTKQGETVASGRWMKEPEKQE